MSHMPSFLRIGQKLHTDLYAEKQSGLEDYKPLLGLWLIDMSLSLHWTENPPLGTLGRTFSHPKFVEMTGIKEFKTLLTNDSDEESEDDFFLELEADPPEDGLKSITSADPHNRKTRPKRQQTRIRHQKIKKFLKSRRQELVDQGISPDLPLFQNVERLGRMVHLNETEQAILTFAACLSCFTSFNEFISNCSISLRDDAMASLLSSLTGQPAKSIRKALRCDSVLITSGLISLEHDETDLEGKITMVNDLQAVMLDVLASDDELSRRVLRPSKPAILTLADFNHLAPDIELLIAYLAGGQKIQAKGINILLYGPPGTGKTEFAKALAAHCGLNLFDIGFADEDGDPLSGEQRLHSLTFCQRALKDKAQVALLFDEVEDVLPGQHEDGLFGMLFANKSEGNKGGKAWINRALEDNPVPTIWITNNANIDSAYLRRFDYSLALRIPPQLVRTRMVTTHLGQHAPNAAAVSAIAALDDLLPAQLERAARVAQLSSLVAPEHAWRHVEMTLQRSRSLLGQSRKNLIATARTEYSLTYLNTDADIAAILNGLRIRPQASFCLYGPSGTGKTQLARHFAGELGKPVLIKRASDLLNKYVGGTEQRIAAMFEQALDEDAVLLLDEADTFLSDRRGAQQHWEATQTNELLTQLECFDGIFFATTNMMDKLEPASLRRFSHKVKFDYLKPQQGYALFVQEFCRLGGSLEEAQNLQDKVHRLEDLAPGDFAVVVKNLSGLGESPSAPEFLRRLEAETFIKARGKGKVGFL